MAWQTTQASLLEKLRDPGDGIAWREFDRQYGQLILAYCRSRGLQVSDAEDVRQMVMLNLSRTMPRFRYQPERGRFRSYLGRTVRNAIIRHASGHDRRARALGDSVIEGCVDTEDNGNDALWERQWIRHHYRLALKTLRRTMDSKSLEIFDRLLTVRSAIQVAEAFDTTPEAVRKVKQRVRQRLRELISEQVRREDEPGE